MKIHCSGIGGIGLSAYAAFQRAKGHTVSGSDRSQSIVTDALVSQGIEVSFVQDGSAIAEDADLFVYSEAIPVDAPERVKASVLGIRCLSYFAALGELSKDYRVIAVCGTHGKSSTTAMAARVLLYAGLDPSIIVGTRLTELNGANWRVGESDVFLLEACEYRRSFLNLYPDTILMTNVDGDHFDAFDSLEDYQHAFVEFLERLPDDGVLISHGSDADCVKVVSEAKRELVNADTYDLPQLSVPGTHMQSNAQLVVALSQTLGLDESKAREALSGYSGCWRRMEYKGTLSGGIDVYDDYAHHPKEVRATLDGVRSGHHDRRIVCVYQPHTHDRTLRFYDDFLDAFNSADVLIVSNVYDARSDIEHGHVDMDTLIADIQSHSSKTTVIRGGSLDETQLQVAQHMREGDVIIYMGAGDITTLASALVS